MKIAVLGGGVIGLSTAWELATRGHKVTLIDNGRFGRKASWAGAGILLPGNAKTAIHPMEHLEAASNELHESWSRRLLAETGIDNGYRKCGGLYVATTPGEIATLAGSLEFWKDRNIEAIKLSEGELVSKFPLLSHFLESDSLLSAWLPDEAQICNPWHVKALIQACKNLSVELLQESQATVINRAEGIINSIRVEDRQIDFDVMIIACGAWTQQAVDSIARCIQMVPVRGQMILYRLEEALKLPIINEGTRYIVPRDDGHVLVGATIEEVGFDETTTEDTIAKLAEDANRLMPLLTEDKIRKTWAGLRPGTHDAFPYMGRLPELENTFVSTGHFKTGLQLSSGSAVAMADLIEGKETLVDLTPFDPSRVLL